MMSCKDHELCPLDGKLDFIELIYIGSKFVDGCLTNVR